MNRWLGIEQDVTKTSENDASRLQYAPRSSGPSHAAADDGVLDCIIVRGPFVRTHVPAVRKGNEASNTINQRKNNSRADYLEDEDEDADDENDQEYTVSEDSDSDENYQLPQSSKTSRGAPRPQTGRNEHRQSSSANQQVPRCEQRFAPPQPPTLLRRGGSNLSLILTIYNSNAHLARLLQSSARVAPRQAAPGPAVSILAELPPPAERVRSTAVPPSTTSHHKGS